MSVFIFLFLVTESLCAGIGVYEEVYPNIDNLTVLQTAQHCVPDSSNNFTCPLFFVLLSSLGGFYRTSGCIPGVKMALDEINRNPHMLPGYSLHYSLKDSQCNRQVAMSSFFSSILQPPVKLAVIGSGCSVATEPTAELSYFYNLTQLSYASSSPSLANRFQFRTYFQLLASEVTLAYGYLGLIHRFRWRKVAIISQMENLFTKVTDLVTAHLRASNVSYTETTFETSGGVSSLEDRLFDAEARIFIISMYSPQALEVLCKAYEAKMYYPRYQFIFPAWYNKYWWVGTPELQQRMLQQYHQCTVSNRERVLQYSLAIDKDEFITNFATISDSGITGQEFYKLYHKLLAVSPYGNESILYVQQSYDATWTLARALNQTLNALANNQTLNDLVSQYNSDLNTNEKFGLEHMTYNNTAMRDIMFDYLTATDFIGVSGRIVFNPDGVRNVESILVFQYRFNEPDNLTIEVVGSIDIQDKNNLTFNFSDGIDIPYLWPHGNIPYDGVVIMKESTIHTAVTTIFSVLATVGLILAIVCTLFNIIFRKRKLMKLSSPSLNHLIGGGAVVLYLNMYLFIIPTTNSTAVTVLCNVSPWLAAIGYSLCYGTVVMKMMRTFYIFNNAMSTSPKKTIHDWMLALGVLGLIVVDVTILSIFTIINKNDLVAVALDNKENPGETGGDDNPLGIITRYFVYVCDSSARDITVNVLYGIKAVVQVIALIFAFTIRKVEVKGLDDSPFVIASIYVSSIFLAIIFVSSLTLKDYVNTYSAVFSTGYLVATTTILILTFIPKMVGLYKDPHGTKIFKNPHSELSTESKKRKISRSSQSASELIGSIHEASTATHRSSLTRSSTSYI